MHNYIAHIIWKWGRGKGQIFTLKQERGGGIYFLNETSACGLNAWMGTVMTLIRIGLSYPSMR
jgi:hypothetical protein